MAGFKLVSVVATLVDAHLPSLVTSTIQSVSAALERPKKTAEIERAARTSDTLVFRQLAVMEAVVSLIVP